MVTSIQYLYSLYLLMAGLFIYSPLLSVFQYENMMVSPEILIYQQIYSKRDLFLSQILSQHNDLFSDLVRIIL